MSDDPRIRAMLGLIDETPLLPKPREERIDMQRCVVYPVSKAATAMGLFKEHYKCEPTFCTASNIGGKKAIEAWVVGYIPENWSEHG